MLKPALNKYRVHILFNNRLNKKWFLKSSHISYAENTNTVQTRDLLRHFSFPK